MSDVNSSSPQPANPHCVSCGHALTHHGRATGTSLSGCHLCGCGAAVAPVSRLVGGISSAAMAPVNLQQGDSVEITERVTFSDPPFGGRSSRFAAERFTFEDLIERIQALTGLNPRKASVVAAEIAELGGVTPSGEFYPFDPPDHLLVATAKEAGYLPDSWRLP